MSGQSENAHDVRGSTHAALRALRGVLLVAGIALGLIHLGMSLQAVFMFREGEPIWSWLVIGAGPASTLPAVVVSAFWPGIGGAWLLLGGLVSLLALVVLEGGIAESFLPALIRVAAPMAVLGTAFLLGRKR